MVHWRPSVVRKVDCLDLLKDSVWVTRSAIGMVHYWESRWVSRWVPSTRSAWGLWWGKKWGFPLVMMSVRRFDPFYHIFLSFEVFDYPHVNISWRFHSQSPTGDCEQIGNPLTQQTRHARPWRGRTTRKRRECNESSYSTKPFSLAIWYSFRERSKELHNGIEWIDDANNNLLYQVALINII